MPVAYQPLTDEFVVNPFTAGYQAAPAIATLSDGSFIVFWSDISSNQFTGMLGHHYDRDGIRQGGFVEASVNSPADSPAAPDVAALDDRGFAVVWQSTHSENGSSQTDVLMRIYGGAVGGRTNPFVVHAPSDTHQNTPTVTKLADGDILVTWQSYSADQSDIELWARRFTPTGTPLGDQFLLTGSTEGVQSLASVAALPDGGFMVAWQHVVFGGSNDYDVYARRFARDGTAAGDAFRVNLTTFSHQMRPDVLAFADGSFLIAWQSHFQSGETDYGIFAQRFDASGNRLGGEFRLPSTMAGDQSEVDLLALPSGGFLATWQSHGTDGSGGGVYGRYFDQEGNGLADQFAIHTFNAGDQFDPHAAFLNGGRIALAWESIGADGSDHGIAGRLFATNQLLPTYHADFNGDHRGDMLLRGDGRWLTSWTGTSTGALVNNGALQTLNLPLNWKVAGTGDFNGDGFQDVLLLRSDGEVWMGWGNFGGRLTVAYHTFLSGSNIAGVGDFNGDGLDDMLIRSQNWVTYWVGKPNGQVGTFVPNASLFFTTDWKVASTGDYNGDGYADILLRRDDGWVTNWLGTANGGFTNNGANTALFFTLDWKVVGSGDINGDGRDDLVLRRDDGWITDWLGTANGGFTNNGANTALFLTTDWKISSIADFNGDGRDDILLRNDSGWLTNWLGTATGSFVNNGANFSTFVAPEWVVQDAFL